jgi:hypothetical protein
LGDGAGIRKIRTPPLTHIPFLSLLLPAKLSFLLISIPISPQEAERREALREGQGGQLDFTSLLDTPKGAPIASRWIIRSGRLPQFQLAGALLYKGNEQIEEG